MPANDPDPNELIHIKHAGIKALGGPVTRDAFDAVWSRKGWSVASASDVAKAEEATADAALGVDPTAPAGKVG